MSVYNIGKVEGKDIQVGDGNMLIAGSESPRRCVILAVFANPYGTDGIRLDEEYRAIDRAIRAGSHRDRLDLVPAPAARYGDLGQGIQYHRPVVVHIGNHGSPTGELVLADETGLPVEVSAATLADLFANHATTTRCVVLNGCHTERLATAIAAHGPCVVGTSRAIPDKLAIEFAGAFYTAIANGRRFDEAFADGLNHLDAGDRVGGDAIVFAAGRGRHCGNAID